MFIVPSIFTIWSLYSLLKRPVLSAQSISILLGAMIIGLYIGTQLSKIIASRRIDNSRIEIPGSIMMLYLSLTAFTIKYGFGVTRALVPDISARPSFYSAELAVMGIISGIFWGRLIGLWYKKT